jgi:thioredoxin-related protein
MKLSRLLLLLLISLSLKSYAQAPSEPAEQILKEACQQAAKEKKNVFIIFHASWCGWCHKMDEAMNDPAVKTFFDKNYVIRHLTVYESKGKEALENPGALALLTKYGGNDQGIPYWLVFDKSGNLLADSQVSPKNNTGCPASKEEVAYFVQVLQKTASLTTPELAIIADRFRKNE